MGMPGNLIGRELAKFVSPQAGGDAAAVIVTNPDGSNIFGGSAIGIQSLPSIQGNISFSGVVSLASGQYIGIGTNSSLPSINGLVQVNNVASLASIYGLVNITSLPSINGLVNVTSLPSIQGQVFVNNVASLASIYGLVGLAGLTSLASGQFIGLNGVISLASGQTILTKEQNLISLASGQYIGIAANSSLPSIYGQVALASQANFIGGVSIYGTLTTNPGITSLASGQYIAIATNSSLPSIYGTVALASQANFIGGVSVYGNLSATISGLTSLASGQYIGIATNSSLPSINGSVQIAANSSLPSIQGNVFVNNVASLASIYGVVSLAPNTNSGWSKYSFLSLATGTQMVKTSAGELGGWFIGNANATLVYVSVFDQASGSASLGARVPDIIMTIPPGGAANMESANGINFTTAIQIAASMTPLGGSGPSIGLPVSFWYK